MKMYIFVEFMLCSDVLSLYPKNIYDDFITKLSFYLIKIDNILVEQYSYPFWDNVPKT